MNYKASVIVPVYNAEKTLRRCVESIALGRERNVEIILVDDCSKDQSWKLCQALAEEFPNVHPVQNAKNSGVSYTRNHGLREAQGEYILFVDSDDWVSEWFAFSLLQMKEQHENILPIVGYYFIDEVSGSKSEYLLSKSESINIITPENYFDVLDAVLMQSIWNKIFDRKVIDDNGIYFDETQNMGEDFQFVLDYLKCTKTAGCAVLNRPLYYYVRANNTSLMSKLAVEKFEESANRMKQLAELGHVQGAILEREIKNLQQNFLYHISKYRGYDKNEKIEQIEVVMQDGQAKRLYHHQKTIQFKEKLLGIPNRTSYFLQRVSGRLQREKRAKVIQKAKQELRNNQVTIIAQNCIGGVFYHDMGMQFSSPMINLYFKAKDFSKFVLHLQEYMGKELQMSWGERYPVGQLGDIQVYFAHYKTCAEAKEAWERRKERIDWNRIVVCSTDQENFDDACYEQWKQISYPKVLFTAQKKFSEGNDAVYFPQYESAGCVPDLIPDREFYKDGTLLRVINQLSEKELYD